MVASSFNTGYSDYLFAFHFMLFHHFIFSYALAFSLLLQMSKYFSAYRIDHILGFFRIWELPDHALTGLVGKFRPSIPLSQVT